MKTSQWTLFIFQIIVVASTAEDNSTFTPCPETQPTDGETCSPFLDSFCSYGEFCCEGTGECVTSKACYCEEGKVSCFDSWTTLACPSACPSSVPQNGDVCNIDYRFTCGYGGLVVCEESESPIGYAQQCNCYQGSFECSKNACPISCPEAPLTTGDDCSPFYEGSCSYGEICCNSGECVPDRYCECDENFKTRCFESTIYCPLECPSTRPINGEGCELSERIACNYDEGSCEESFECQCTNDNFSCYNSCFESEEDEWEGGESRTDLGTKEDTSDKTGSSKQEESQTKGKKEQNLKEKKDGDQKKSKDDKLKSKNGKKNERRLNLYRIRGLN